jgi:hypothetical protein
LDRVPGAELLGVGLGLELELGGGDGDVGGDVEPGCT